MPRSFQHIDVTIPNGAAVAPIVNLGGWTVVAISMPGAWTTAGLSFSAADEIGGTGVSLVDDGGTEITVTATADDYIALVGNVKEALAACQNLIVRSGTVGSPVNQGADRIVKLIVASE